MIINTFKKPIQSKAKAMVKALGDIIYYNMPSHIRCDILDLVLIRIDRLLIPTKCIFFSWKPICLEFQVKRAWWGVILG